MKKREKRNKINNSWTIPEFEKLVNAFRGNNYQKRKKKIKWGGRQEK
jgi:hypothetical protein